MDTKGRSITGVVVPVVAVLYSCPIEVHLDEEIYPLRVNTGVANDATTDKGTVHEPVRHIEGNVNTSTSGQTDRHMDRHAADAQTEKTATYEDNAQTEA